ncbi:Alkyl hydroperoxide reductase/ Thiol specific antioxidant/ Mal allergen precursor [Sphingobium yanoikuyae]|uniref:thioredoxin-dependent peroxiredoxin n=1 Tax=Sphingobium yanoikuyae TaxID=13690 RepID=A0A084ENZ1_SPHYA|nr:peroxiredoxin [Sphingobium yanoikuyae]KEZ19683.1 Alkyl hydroperoxide reductase/ Thiol specific antioxidant/ Mal allergen precursor [Sphingobium yanoikuyae]
MKSAKIILALAAAALGTQGSMAALAVGAKAPEFTTRGALAGKTFTVTLSHQLKRGPVVLYFFPKAFTPGCSAEAREFAENIDKFKAAGATVIGMSADPVDDLVAFSTKECAGKFAVASAGPNIVSGYDVALKMRPGMTDRTSYVIAPSGRIAFVHSEMSYAGHVKSTLAAVEAMAMKQK